MTLDDGSVAEIQIGRLERRVGFVENLALLALAILAFSSFCYWMGSREKSATVDALAKRIAALETLRADPVAAVGGQDDPSLLRASTP